jgi:hypothetical protein
VASQLQSLSPHGALGHLTRSEYADHVSDPRQQRAASNPAASGNGGNVRREALSIRVVDCGGRSGRRLVVGYGRRSQDCGPRLDVHATRQLSGLLWRTVTRLITGHRREAPVKACAAIRRVRGGGALRTHGSRLPQSPKPRLTSDGLERRRMFTAGTTNHDIPRVHVEPISANVRQSVPFLLGPLAMYSSRVA